MKVQDIHIDGYNYNLPDDRIARHPLAMRDSCRLLVCGGDNKITDSRFSSLPALLPPRSVLVCNDTKVINARIELYKPSGTRIEVFLLEPCQPADYNLAFRARGECVWKALVGNLKRWKGDCLTKELVLDSGESVLVRAEHIRPLEGGSQLVRFSWTPAEIPFTDVVEAIGQIPIPPYLNRKAEESDSSDYQTVFSRFDGSVAAPTAGLHFTPRLNDSLIRSGVDFIRLTLHVGAGTFRPVKSEEIGDHTMHSEKFVVTRDALQSLISAIEDNRPIFAVGTTSVRTLESLPYLGAALRGGDDSFHIGQWSPYEQVYSGMDTMQSLKFLLGYMREREMNEIIASTSIMIAPGFRWRIVKGLITNFHQPGSTLLLLVASFLGDEPEDPSPLWRKVYDFALDNDYRFLSYGDACLFMPRI